MEKKIARKIPLPGKWIDHYRAENKTFQDEQQAAHDKAQESYKRIEVAGVKEGQRVHIGNQFAQEYDYEIYVGAEGKLYSIMQYDAQAVVALDKGKLVIVEIEDCLPVNEKR